MAHDPLVSRRAVLRAAALGAGGLVLGACVPSSSAPTAAPGSAGASANPSQPPPSTAATPGGSASAIPLRQRIARLLVVGFRGLRVSADDWIAQAIAVDGLGGVILFDKDRVEATRNVRTPRQVTRLIGDVRTLAPARELIVAIDQEGGQVTRLSPTYGFPALASEAAIGPKTDAEVRAWADGLVATLADVGINLNLAPVVDLNINPRNPAIGALGRAFSADPAVVAKDAAIENQAHRMASIRTTLKHFPGLGSASTNTDFGVSDVTSTWTAAELDPYRALLGQGLVDVVMAGHVVNGQIDHSAPASLSRGTVTDLLRDELGWDGVVITDDLQAGAITEAFGAEDAVALALDAGNDLLLFANQQVYDPAVVTNTIDLIEGFVTSGRIPEARIDRSYARVTSLFPDVG
ncbi:MAG TPA: glycoside hydrolase family 3 N-terminal domain-containing protein [Patescibacteria group bacterium]|nr:glycoside hydrolase family 3 N-terminal domain-containing protein [Patescibacteria group bacterium]